MGERAVRDAEACDYKGMMEQFCVLTVVMVTQIYTCDKICRAIHSHTQKNQFYCLIFKKNLII